MPWAADRDPWAGTGIPGLGQRSLGWGGSLGLGYGDLEIQEVIQWKHWHGFRAFQSPGPEAVDEGDLEIQEVIQWKHWHGFKAFQSSGLKSWGFGKPVPRVPQSLSP